MKAWLGSTAYEVTQEQLDALNKAAESKYRETGDRAKGLEAAIAYVKKEKCKVLIKNQPIMPSGSGEGLAAGLTEEQLQEKFNEMFAAAMEAMNKKK